MGSCVLRSEPPGWRVWGQRPGQPSVGCQNQNFSKGKEIKMFEDKILVCKDCGAQFTFTAGEQEFYAEKGFQNEPVRCKACRCPAGSEPTKEDRDNWMPNRSVKRLCSFSRFGLFMMESLR